MKKLGTSRTVAILFLCSLMAACSASAPASPTASPRQVSLQLQWVTQAQFAGYYVALEKGWYKEEGIDLTIKPGGPDLVPVDLVAAGTRDFGTALLADLSVAVQTGKPVISIGQIQQANGLLLIAKKSSGIKQPQDFKGKKVGVWFGSWEAQFNALIAKEGIAPDDLTVVSQGWSMDPFIKDELDVASAMIYNEYHMVLESGLKTQDVNIIDYAAYGLDFPGDTLFTTRQMTTQDPDLCTRMLRASLRGWQYAIDNPEEAADIVLKYDTSGVQTKQHQLAMMQEISKLVSVKGSSLGKTDQAAVQRTVDALLLYKILGGAVKPEDVFTNEFWEKAQTK